MSFCLFFFVLGNRGPSGIDAMYPVEKPPPAGIPQIDRGPPAAGEKRKKGGVRGGDSPPALVRTWLIPFIKISNPTKLKNKKEEDATPGELNALISS